MNVLAAALAVLAAALFAVAAAVQQRTAAAVPDDRAGGLVLTLVRRPLWWVGTLADTGGYVAQAAGLGLGSLLLVQPLLVTSLLFALPLGARWAGRSLRRSEWSWSALLVAALAVFVVSGEPTGQGSIVRTWESGRRPLPCSGRCWSPACSARWSGGGRAGRCCSRWRRACSTASGRR